MFDRMFQSARGGGGSRGGNQGGDGGERGFAAMDPEEQRRIARKGGEAVSEDREHMAEMAARAAKRRTAMAAVARAALVAAREAAASRPNRFYLVELECTNKEGSRKNPAPFFIRAFTG